MIKSIIICILFLSTVVAFTGTHNVQKAPSTTALFAVDRRRWLAGVATTATAWLPAVALAMDTKTFVDPQGYFAITIPKNYFALRRSAKGDLPDDKTGKGRRGSSIFTAGDMAKAEVIAVERCVLVVLCI